MTTRDLVYFTAMLDPKTAGLARQHAFSGGRVLEREGLGVLTFGKAGSIPLPNGSSDLDAARDVVNSLGSIACVDSTHNPHPYAQPLALGALPFDPTTPSELVVPEVVVINIAGHESIAIGVTTSAHFHSLQQEFPFNPDSKVASLRDEEAPDRFSLISIRSHADFRDRVEAAIGAIQAGELEKLVLAREVVIEANRAFSQRQLLERMRVLHPSCASFAIDGFFGASPELLCRRFGNEVLSHPLAGTVPRSGDPEDDERLARQLLDSPKERSEHDFVVDAIVETLQSICEGQPSADGPHVLELRNVAHLATTIKGRLREDSSAFPISGYASALELACALHPTPAVGGVPREAALSYIAKFEDLDRDRYAGPVGFVRADGDGEWWLGLRSAVIEGTVARLFAGVGIVASSDPETELVETQLKLQALLATTVRP